jgi:hypothetical protein
MALSSFGRSKRGVRKPTESPKGWLPLPKILKKN